jgi:hypothetical protein
VISEHDFSGQKRLPPGLYCTEHTKQSNVLALSSSKLLGLWKAYFSRTSDVCSRDLSHRLRHAPFCCADQKLQHGIGNNQFKRNLPRFSNLFNQDAFQTMIPINVYLLSRKFKSSKHFLHVVVQY